MNIPPRHFIVVGAGDTLEFLDMAESDQSLIVWAFEPNPHVVASVLSSRRLPANYRLTVMAVSDFTGRSTFNVCTNAPCSSLKNWGDGPRFGEMSAVDVAVTRLDDFMVAEAIREVEYLHVDAQGSDLDVLRGLGDRISAVRAGQCESLAPGVPFRLYDGQPGFEEVEGALRVAGFETSWAQNVNNGLPGQEVNISFRNTRPPRQLGIMLMKDEDDILEEYLTRATHWCDRILVMDGTDGGRGEEICSRFPEVALYARDREFPGPPGDHLRGHLWERAKSICPEKDWACILHPDEFPSRNPLEVIGQVSSSRPGIEALMVKNVHYFPHTSQEGCWSWRPGRPIEPEMRWCMWPGCDEFRYIRFDTSVSYGGSHGTVVPDKVYPTFYPNAEMFHHKHFTIRSLEQTRKRAADRFDSGWQRQMYDGLIDTDTIFFSDLTHLFSGAEARRMW